MAIVDVLERIQAGEDLDLARVNKLATIVSYQNRVKLARYLDHQKNAFVTDLIQSFIGVNSPNLRGLRLATKSQDYKNRTEYRELTTMSWEPLTPRWLKHKRQRGLSTPNFFSYGLRLGQSPSRPEKTLKDYLEENSRAIQNRLGSIEPSNIYYLSLATGQKISLKKGRYSKTEAALLLQGLFPRSRVRGLSEDYSDNVVAYISIWEFGVGSLISSVYGSSIQKDLSSDQTQKEVTTWLIPEYENTRAEGFPVSKLLNNGQTIRPTLVPLVLWYLRVKLPALAADFIARSN